jgi:hypothetical protein
MFEQKGLSDITFVDAVKAMEANTGVPLGDLQKLIQPLSPNLPNVAPVMSYLESLARNNQEILQQPWTMTGQANPSSRFSGSSLSMLQEAVKLGQQLISSVIGRSTENNIRVVCAIQRRHWTAYHRVLYPGMEGRRANAVIVDPEMANAILAGETVPDGQRIGPFKIEGQKVVLNGIRARIKDADPENRFQVYRVTPGTTNVMADPMFAWLQGREDVDVVTWVANCTELADADVGVTVEAESAVHDQEAFSRLQVMQTVSPGLLAKEVQARLGMSGVPWFSWAENAKLLAVDKADEFWAQLPPEQKLLTMQIMQSGQIGQSSPQGTLPPGPPNAAQTLAPVAGPSPA